MPTIAIIANAHSRQGAGWKLCEPMVRERGYRVFMVGDDSLDSQVAQAAAEGCETIVALGGDGTISSVADAVVRHGGMLRLGVVPAGTLNHFAKDLSIPLDLKEALDLVSSGRTVHVDVARVNERHFINNSSIGFYPTTVKERKPLERKGMNGWIAFAYSIVSLGLRRPVYEVDFGRSKNLAPKRTSSIFIGNNKYLFEGMKIGARERIDDGLLFVALISHMRALRAASLIFKITRGMLFHEPDINATGLSECTIAGRGKKILVSIDGEIAEMDSPLHYSILPKALRVIVPAS